jgi:hypothetical protein
LKKGGPEGDLLNLLEQQASENLPLPLFVKEGNKFRSRKGITEYFEQK